MILTCVQLKVLELAEENFGTVQLGSPLREMGDSLELANFVLDLEEEFGMDVPDEDMHKIVDLHGVVDYVENYGKSCN